MATYTTFSICEDIIFYLASSSIQNLSIAVTRVRTKFYPNYIIHLWNLGYHKIMLLKISMHTDQRGESITWSSCFKSTHTMTSSSSCPTHNDSHNSCLSAGHRIWTPSSSRMTPRSSYSLLLFSAHGNSLNLELQSYWERQACEYL